MLLIYLSIYIYIYIYIHARGPSKKFVATRRKMISSKYNLSLLKTLFFFLHMLLFISSPFRVIQQWIMRNKEIWNFWSGWWKLRNKHLKCMKITPFLAYMFLNGTRSSKRVERKWKMILGAGGFQQVGLSSCWVCKVVCGYLRLTFRTVVSQKNLKKETMLERSLPKIWSSLKSDTTVCAAHSAIPDREERCHCGKPPLFPWYFFVWFLIFTQELKFKRIIKRTCFEGVEAIKRAVTIELETSQKNCSSSA